MPVETFFVYFVCLSEKNNKLVYLLDDVKVDNQFCGCHVAWDGVSETDREV